MHPYLILTVGISSVLGLILVLRVHAFLALIISAMVVSLLAPGPIETKISRVADAFGTSAGSIAIVIALAAIIGECMMASGAADRIVQAFLSLLGEKRASWALLASGYVLAIPVFFDTVFYLLIPLARSLFRRTQKNYLLYVMAIAAGGAITHTLVPPTPGPLVMASTLGVDVGLMILVGAIVAFPAAVAGLAFSRFLDGWMPIPFRDDKIIGTEDDHPEVPVNHPPLWLSIMPVALPVVLISANTALTSMANNERAARLTPAQVRSWEFLLNQTADGGNPPKTPTGRLVSLLPEETRKLLDQKQSLTDVEQLQVIDAINTVLEQKSPSFYEHEFFDDMLPERWKTERDLAVEGLSAEEQTRLKRLLVLDSLLQKDFSSLQLYDRERMNRILLEAAFPDTITPHVWNTPMRKAADISSLFGNANLALLLSAAVSMYLLYRQKHPTLSELSQTVENSLMSGGTIILITAAGGAFGAMLKVAQIGDAIKASFASEGTTTGLMFLFLGYGVSGLMKVAQGSSTVAMITVSGMLAAMIGNVNLGYHPVYLATAIGAGSLIGSWMNDSGFWIYAKMGRLTETESLKSWTLLLLVLSSVSFGVTLILSQILPLV